MKALITGASSGIGRDMARTLNKKGYDLVLVARNVEKLNAIKTELEKKSEELKLNNKIEIKSVDLTKEDECINLANEYKDIDVLINNAGFGDCGRFTDTDLEKDISMIKTNVLAYHILTKMYLKEMNKRNKKGHIMNVASIAGFMPGPLMATYYATKNYVVKLSESIREELIMQRSKVKISLLCPGPVKTNFNNVANVRFNLREANSKLVAEYAIWWMEHGKFYIVPGIDIKIAWFAAKIIPSNIMAKITYWMQRRKIYRKNK